MTEDLQLRGYAEPTIRAYLLAVSQLAKFYGIAPDQITEEQLRTTCCTGRHPSLDIDHCLTNVR